MPPGYKVVQSDAGAANAVYHSLNASAVSGFYDHSTGQVSSAGVPRLEISKHIPFSLFYLIS